MQIIRFKLSLKKRKFPALYSTGIAVCSVIKVSIFQLVSFHEFLNGNESRLKILNHQREALKRM